jgi:3-oxoadipate enol-lactonase/4-carboxymuconolactone decarboxylase
MIGQWLGANASGRISALILANTSPLVGPKSAWEDRRKRVLEKGMASILDFAMRRFFSSAVFERNDPFAGGVRQTFLTIDPVGYAGCCAAIRDMDHTALLREISAPTLIIAGDRDIATPLDGHSDVLAREISGAKLVHLDAAHLSCIERPHSFAAAVLDFLLPAETADTYEAGLKVRREALGDAHVDRALASATELNRDFQELITRYAWGSIWTRPGLDRRTRRLLVLVMTASLGRWEEFRMHLRAGLAHELEPCDVKEALLQTAIYAGVPAANTGFAIAREEIEKK